MFETFIAPDFESKSNDQIASIANFSATRLVGFSSSLKTAIDQRERDEILSDMIMCGASLALLNLAYLSEDDRVLAAAKDLLRRV